MAIKKQKRSPDAAGLPRNGEPMKKVPKTEGKLSEKDARSLKKNPKKPKAVVPIKTEVKVESVGKSAKSEVAKRKAKVLKTRENRKEARKETGQYKPERLNLSAEEIETRIREITAREEISKTAKRKLGMLKKKLAIMNGTFVPTVKRENAAPKVKDSAKQDSKKKVEKKNAPSDGAASAKGGLAPTLKKKAQGLAVKSKTAAKKKSTPSDEQLAEESDESEDDASDEQAPESEDENTSEDEEMSEEDELSEEDDDVSEEEGDDDDDDEDDETEIKYALPEGKIKEEKPATKQAAKNEAAKAAASNGDGAGKKKRFVLFVGNLSYEATAEDLKKHFLTKVSSVMGVRVPTKPGTNTPRGIAYVEFTNETDYQKGLGLHNTSLNGRRINVQYTQGGSKAAGKRSEVVSKNKKLHAMRKSGMLAGKRDDRNDRRKKQKTT